MIQNQRQIYVCLHVSLVGVFVRWFVCADWFKHLMTVWPCQQHIAALKSEIKTGPNESKKPLRQVSWAFLPWFEPGNTAKGSFWGNCSLRAFKGRWISCTSPSIRGPGPPGALRFATSPVHRRARKKNLGEAMDQIRNQRCYSYQFVAA